ncbi:hypothetical protein [Umezawaea beigongshangensis]|uniref:hypothetical protein n=1 Tax=Umezawaea beigongshangensis TaxID=2780383 RepID=UPI0018F1C230|nr:hypothetical protein [Umezawaea beigongshangensis]
MRNRVFVAVGVVLALLGVLWTLQGLGLVTGSFMTGQSLWTAIGLLSVVGGVTLLVSGLRRTRRR